MCVPFFAQRKYFSLSLSLSPLKWSYRNLTDTKRNDGWRRQSCRDGNLQNRNTEKQVYGELDGSGGRSDNAEGTFGLGGKALKVNLTAMVIVSVDV